MCITTICGILSMNFEYAHDFVNQYGHTVKIFGYGIYATKGTADLFEVEGLYVHRASKIETEDGKNVLDIIRN